MGSLYLTRLSQSQRDNLIKKLHESQNGFCFICNEKIDLVLHNNSIDIDHIVPTKLNGKDDPSNFALTHSSCNRSKQASDLKIARLLYDFNKLKDSVANENRGPNLNDVFNKYGGSRYSINFSRANNRIRYSLAEIGCNDIIELPVYKDKLSGFEYFFTKMPIEYLFHDDKINPRPISQNVSKLVHEFYAKRPQLHISLAWINTKEEQIQVKIFDGQHKAAAQVLLGIKSLPVRIFINPDPEILLTTNTIAGTTLRQVAFDKSVQRHLGSALYIDRVDKYKQELNIPPEDYKFSESDLVKFYKGESREMKKYILDAVRDSITQNADNKLKDYIDLGGRGREKPLSYSTIEKTFYSFFIFLGVLETPINFKLDEGENPRELEKEQITELMNIIAEEIFISKFDTDIGTSQIENKIQKGENIPLEHLIAFRMSKEEIIYNWLRYIQQIIKNYFIMQGKPIQEDKVFQYKFPITLWDRIRTFIRNLSNLPVWKNKELSATVFGGKQVNNFWQNIFENGTTPQGLRILSEPLDLMKMIEE